MVAGVVLLLLEEDNTVRCLQFLLEILVSACYDIACCGTLIVERAGGSGVVLVLGIGEVAACIEVESGLDEVFSYLIIHVTIGLMSVERCRSGMVHRDACAHTYGRACLFCPHSHTVHRCLQVGKHTYNAVLRLVACGKCRAGSGRIGHAVCGRICRHKACIWKLCELKRLHADESLHSGKIGFGAVHLINPHTVADEIEHILGAPFGKRRHRHHEQSYCGQKKLLHIFMIILFYYFR